MISDGSPGERDQWNAFTQHADRGRGADRTRPNVDTDMIIPKQFLKTINRAGLRQASCSTRWRYEDQGQTGMDCAQRAVGRPTSSSTSRAYRNAPASSLRGDNFGCGSSREHARLGPVGFRHSRCVIVAPRFADIFYNNCLQERPSAGQGVAKERPVVDGLMDDAVESTPTATS